MSHQAREQSSAEEPRDGTDASRLWLPEITERIASFLPPNEVALTLRLVDRAAAVQFKDRHVVKLSEPSPRPAFAARWSPPAACRSLTLEQRRQLVCLTAAAGDVANLAAAVEAAGVVLDEKVLRAAAKAGKLETCLRLCDDDELQQMLVGAAEGGHTELCECILDVLSGPETVWTERAVRNAARGGHVELTEWLLSVRPGGCEEPQWGDLLGAAVEGCNLAAFQHLCGRHGGLGALSSKQRAAVLAAAVASPTVDWRAKAEWLVTQGCALQAEEESGSDSDDGFGLVKEDPVRDACASAARLPGDAALERFAWLEAQGNAPGKEEQLLFAVQAGNLAAVRHLLALGVRCSLAGMDWVECPQALELGMLQALHGAGCDLGPYGDEEGPRGGLTLAESACRRGKLEVVQWLLGVFGEEEVDLTSKQMCIQAARSGSGSLLRWMPAKGCQFGCGAWEPAAASGSEEALELLHGWGVPFADEEYMELGEVWAAAARHGDLRTLRALRRLPGGGFPWGDDNGGGVTFTWCIADENYNTCPVECLKELVALGCPVDWELAEERAKMLEGGSEDEGWGDDRGRPRPVLDWVREQRRKFKMSSGAREPGRMRIWEDRWWNFL